MADVRLSRRGFLGAVAAVPLLGVLGVPAGGAERRVVGRFAAGGFWPAGTPANTPIPANPVLDGNSEAVVRALAENDEHILNVVEYSQPFYVAGPDTPRVRVTATETGNWGDDPFPEPIPVDKAWRPAPGDDGAMQIVDGDRVYGFWQFRWEDDAPVCSWGGSGSVAGKDISVPGACGSGISYLAGTITAEDIAAGKIEHALVFSTDISTPEKFRFPAISTDGSNDRGSDVTLDEGARIQLDPEFDVSTLDTPIERMVAEALQKYGAYNLDNGGAALAFAVQMPANPVQNGDSWTPNDEAYAKIGLTDDFQSLPNIPWTRLHLLKSWNGR